jgi:sarcosine oxidase subunit beta
MTSDVIVIGAGIHGLTAAYHLAQRGISVEVVDKAGVAEGPTGDASGVVRSYYTNSFLAEIAETSATLLADLEDQPGTASGLRRTGGLYLHGADDVEAVRATVDRLGGVGVEAEVLTPAEIEVRHPGLHLDGIAIGVWEPGAGTADPHRTALSYSQLLTALTVPLHLGRAVIGIEELGSGVEVTLDDGSVLAGGRLLIAAGPWTGRLARLIGADLPLTAERHVVVGRRHLPHDLADAVPHVLIDVAAGYYSRPWGDEGYVLGALAATEPGNPDHLDREVTAQEIDRLAGAAARRAPVRGRAVPDRSWASWYDVSPDWQPVIGQIGERTFVDAGTSGHGFKLAPVLGDHVARLLIGEADPRLDQFSPDRFATGLALSGGFGTARILG